MPCSSAEAAWDHRGRVDRPGVRRLPRKPHRDRHQCAHELSERLVPVRPVAEAAGADLRTSVPVQRHQRPRVPARPGEAAGRGGRPLRVQRRAGEHERPVQRQRHRQLHAAEEGVPRAGDVRLGPGDHHSRHSQPGAAGFGVVAAQLVHLHEPGLRDAVAVPGRAAPAAPHGARLPVGLRRPAHPPRLQALPQVDTLPSTRRPGQDVRRGQQCRHDERLRGRRRHLAVLRPGAGGRGLQRHHFREEGLRHRLLERLARPGALGLRQQQGPPERRRGHALQHDPGRHGGHPVPTQHPQGHELLRVPQGLLPDAAAAVRARGPHGRQRARLLVHPRRGRVRDAGPQPGQRLLLPPRGGALPAARPQRPHALLLRHPGRRVAAALLPGGREPAGQDRRPAAQPVPARDHARHPAQDRRAAGGAHPRADQPGHPQDQGQPQGHALQQPHHPHLLGRLDGAGAAAVAERAAGLDAGGGAHHPDDGHRRPAGRGRAAAAGRLRRRLLHGGHAAGHPRRRPLQVQPGQDHQLAGRRRGRRRQAGRQAARRAPGGAVPRPRQPGPGGRLRRGRRARQGPLVGSAYRQGHRVTCICFV
ncbi:hypothetical protein ONE63_003742 [Megalurothrips usitatus]|uniref:Uncharacterized protein n=1 Tax=Megalurothrips usitatus TaxID=439358 RepID=A0AAV7X9Y5_9NEOP|nr:hypothetical protein ONE63_003742 [Megalurothrips usitatus]